MKESYLNEQLLELFNDCFFIKLEKSIALGATIKCFIDSKATLSKIDKQIFKDYNIEIADINSDNCCQILLYLFNKNTYENPELVLLDLKDKIDRIKSPGILIISGTYKVNQDICYTYETPPIQLSRLFTQSSISQSAFELGYYNEIDNKDNLRSYFLVFNKKNRICCSRQQALLNVEGLIQNLHQDENFINDLSDTYENKTNYKRVLTDRLAGDKGIMDNMTFTLAAIAQNVDSYLETIEFWVAYQSIAAGRITPLDKIASDDKVYEPYGFRYDLSQNEIIIESKPTLEQLWLNIILNENFEFGPKAVHDWFMDYRPFNNKTKSSIESMTIYLPTEKNRECVIGSVAQSSSNHLSIELLNENDSHNGLYWGVQLAHFLSKVPKDNEHIALSWPYDESDKEILLRLGIKNDYDIYHIFIKENGIIHEEPHHDITKGWIRINLYSLFLYNVLRSSDEDISKLDWVQLLLEVLKKKSPLLAQKISETIDQSKNLQIKERKTSSLCWVAPPMHFSHPNNADHIWLGSTLILSSKVIKPEIIRWTQSILRNILTCIRNSEIAITYEKEGENTGILQAAIYFLNEIVEHIHCIYDSIRPFGSIFEIKSIKGKTTDNSDKFLFNFKETIGDLFLKNKYNSEDTLILLRELLIIDSSIVFQSFYDLWILWSNTEEWIRLNEFDEDIEFEVFFRAAVKKFVQAGIFRAQILKSHPPSSIEELGSYNDMITNWIKETYDSINIRFEKKDINLHWRIHEEKIDNTSYSYDDHPKNWFIKIIFVSILHAINSTRGSKGYNIIIGWDNSFLSFKMEYTVDKRMISNNNVKYKDNILDISNTKKILEAGIKKISEPFNRMDNEFHFNLKNESENIWQTKFKIPYESFAQ